MDEPVTFKPILWRLVLWKFIPIYMGWAIVILIKQAIKHYSNFSLLDTVVVMLITVTIFSVIFRNKFDFVIFADKINGPRAEGFGLGRESFSIMDLDIHSLYAQSFYEKISGFHTFRSTTGQKIMLTNFIYGKSAVKELYKILENYHTLSIKK